MLMHKLFFFCDGSHILVPFSKEHRLTLVCLDLSLQNNNLVGSVCILNYVHYSAYLLCFSFL